jgi:hypothetical protein
MYNNEKKKFDMLVIAVRVGNGYSFSANRCMLQGFVRKLFLAEKGGGKVGERINCSANNAIHYNITDRVNALTICMENLLSCNMIASAAVQPLNRIRCNYLGYFRCRFISLLSM